jgi:hypothetical protein
VAHLDGIYRPGQFGGEHALGILIAESFGHRDHQIRRATGEAGGVGPRRPVRQPARRAVIRPLVF